LYITRLFPFLGFSFIHYQSFIPITPFEHIKYPLNRNGTNPIPKTRHN
jgi:hypothetical protein